jgi:hypothetical protein
MSMPTARTQRSPRGITSGQKALLHTAKRQLGMDDETYRQMLAAAAGVRSSVDLDAAGFEAVMLHLAACGFAKSPGEHDCTGYVVRKKRWDGELGQRRGMATPAQLARIETDWDLMRWYWAPKGFGNAELGLRAFLKRVAQVADIRFLSYRGAVQAITAMKKIQAKRRGEGVREQG